MNDIILKLNYFIINPLIILLFVIALVVFIWGIIEFLTERNADSDKANTGKLHIGYGLLGMFIMVSAFAIMKVIATTIGSTIPTP